MNNLIIEKGYSTPLVSFNKEINKFEITGESFSEETSHFYQPIMEWLDLYLQVNKHPISLDFRLSYFNTSSSQSIFEMLEMLNDYANTKKLDIEVNWYASENDLDMIEDGEDFQDDFSSLNFNILAEQIG